MSILQTHGLQQQYIMGQVTVNALRSVTAAPSSRSWTSARSASGASRDRCRCRQYVEEPNDLLGYELNSQRSIVV
jgi:hypothetical protein